MKPTQWQSYTRYYSNRDYRHATMVRHNGTVVAFAMDAMRRIYYAVLDRSDPAPRDADNWPTSPTELVFPREMVTVGFGAIAPRPVPLVRLDGTEVPADQPPPPQYDVFRSTTGRLTADAPFQVLSDGESIYLFRQSIAADHPDVTHARGSDGQPLVDPDGAPIPLVDRTLLCDRFVLSGSLLLPRREVRYRRSRNRVVPASGTDSLGAVDMNNQPFFEPTSELDFVKNLDGGRLAVVLLPTLVSDVKRWQIFAHNSATDRIDAFNLPRSADGLFDARGQDTFTCPDHPEHYATESGRCPLPSRADESERCPYDLITRRYDLGFAESALSFSGQGYVDLGTDRAAQPGGIHDGAASASFAISAWIKPEAGGVMYSSARDLNGTYTPAFELAVTDDGRIEVSTTNNSGTDTVVYPPDDDDGASAPAVIFGQWSYVSVVAEDLIFGRGSVRVQVDANEQSFDQFRRPFHVGTQRARIGRSAGDGDARPFRGQIDELQVWSRQRGFSEIEETRMRRLAGCEPELVGYWRLDEGSGNAVHDQTDNAVHGQLVAEAGQAPQWLLSDAPIGDSPGMRRTSFGFAGHAVAGGASAAMYHQSEMVPAGTDDELLPAPQAGRVLLAVTTQPEGSSETHLAALDFGVTGAGRLAQVPDNLELAPISDQGPDFEALVAEAVALEQQIPILQDELRALMAERARQAEQLDEHRAQLVANRAELDRLAGAKARITYGDQALDLTQGTHDPLPTEWIDRVYGIRCDAGIFCEILGDYSTGRGPFTATTSTWRYVQLYGFRPNTKAAVVTLSSAGQTARLQAQQLIELLENDLIPTVVAEIARLDGEIAAKRAELSAAKARLAEVREALTGNRPLPMSLVHIDPAGHSVFGSVLDFLSMSGDPTVANSATSALGVYFRGEDGVLSAVYFDATAERSRLELGQSGLFLLARAAGPDIGRTQLEVTPGPDTRTCTAVLENAAISALNGGQPVRETWRRMPRDPARMAAILNGKAREPIYAGQLASELLGSTTAIPLDRPLDRAYGAGAAVLLDGRMKFQLTASVEIGAREIPIVEFEFQAPATVGTGVWLLEYDHAAHAATTRTGFDLSAGSLLARAAGDERSAVQNTPAVAMTGVGRAASFIPNPPGSAIDFDRRDPAYLDAGDRYVQLARSGDASIEAWARPGFIDRIGRIVDQHSDDSGYYLALERVPLHSAITFTGLGQYVELPAIDLTRRSFSIEFYGQRTVTPRTNQNEWFLSQGPTHTPSRQLHIGFVKNTRQMRFGFIADALDTTETYDDLGFHHWAFTSEYDEETGLSDRRIYRDGNLVAEGRSATTYLGSGPILLGRRPPEAIEERVAIDELRFWGHALTSEEIEARRLERITGREAGLLAYYRFEDALPHNHMTGVVEGTVHTQPTAGPVETRPTWLPGYRVHAGFGTNTRRSIAPIPAYSWHHLAATFEESYAIQLPFVPFGGGWIDCGTSPTLDLDDELTLELSIRRPLGAVAPAPLITRGRANSGDEERQLSYGLYLGSRGVLGFAYRTTDGDLRVIQSPQDTARRNQVTSESVQVAVTRERVADFDESEPSYRVQLFWNGTQIATAVADGFPISSREPTEIGRGHGDLREAGIEGDEEEFFTGTIGDVRVWRTARPVASLHRPATAQDRGLVSHWRFQENGGRRVADVTGQNDGEIRGTARWVRDPDPSTTRLLLFINGEPVQTERAAALSAIPDQLSVGRDYDGSLDEVRVWRTRRTPEQIMDNLFGRLRGEARDLLGYFPFDADPAIMLDPESELPRRIADGSLLGNTLQVVGGQLRHIFTTAPLSDDAGVVRNALAGARPRYAAIITGRPGVSEYADLQQTLRGPSGGVYKRCYGYVERGTWKLFTGYNLGNLAVEWLGQVQFDPQVKGYVEGAPPVPSENLTAGPRNPLVADYVGISTVELTEADNVLYTLSTSRDRGFNTSLEGQARLGSSAEILKIAAPLGFGIATPIVSGEVGLQGAASLETNLNWLDGQQLGEGTNVSRMKTVAMGGNWEDPENRLNSAMSRRFQPANVGFALVESETADVFALRLIHNRTLVALSILPNPDIPRDTNIIPFPINGRYTKQGTLDGRIGFDDRGVVLDPDYPQATGYGEYSYFKPIEAYRLRRQIREEEQRLRSYLEDFTTSPPGATGATIGGAVGGGLAALALSTGGAAAPAAAIAASTTVQAGALIDALASGNDLPEQYAKRDLVNSYVWTADGGFFAEATEVTSVQQESTSGSYNVQGGLTLGYYGALSAGVDVSGELNATFGASLNLTRSRTRDATQSFSVDVFADPPGDLQAYTESPLQRVFDSTGNPIIVPGKVDAYRFLTFYLQPDAQHHDTLFSTVVDPIWLAQSDHPNAVALRQAQNSGRRPACWRLFHRVTFVSRILPELDTVALPPLESAARAVGVESNWALIQRFDPYVRDLTGDAAAFSTEANRVIDRFLPELAESRAIVVEYLRAYYGVDS